jgi:glycosyltransferase involved in cell wall biosynthesis
MGSTITDAGAGVTMTARPERVVARQTHDVGASPTNVGLRVLRRGEFSGATSSLIQALRRLMAVDDVDLAPMSRFPRGPVTRLRSEIEARSVPGTSFVKTAAFTGGFERTVAGKGLFEPGPPILFVQTLHAFVSVPVRYFVYTDRVSLEAASGDPRWRSRSTSGWLERERTFLQRAERVLVMGPHSKPVLVEQYGLAEDQVAVVGTGPGSSVTGIAPVGSGRRILFAGSPFGLKGGPELLAAFTEVQSEFPDLELTVLSSDPPRDLPPGVTVLGRVPHDQMNAVFERADIVAVPSHQEAFGYVILEAALKGMPCLGTDRGNQPWLLGDAGVCADPTDPAALAAALRALVDGFPGFKQRAVARAPELAERFSWDHVARQIAALL